MGCDIHFFVEKKDDNGKWLIVEPPSGYGTKYYTNEELFHLGYWSSIEEYEIAIFTDKYQFLINRDYYLFKILANIRGFSEVSIGNPRGIPADASNEYIRISKPNGDWHSHSYCTIKEFNDLTKGVEIEPNRKRIVNINKYEEYKKTGGTLSGVLNYYYNKQLLNNPYIVDNETFDFYLEKNDIVDIIENDNNKDLFTEIECPSYIENIIDSKFSMIVRNLPEILKKDEKDIRFVFFFDN